jgi:hypothetical protein
VTNLRSLFLAAAILLPACASAQTAPATPAAPATETAKAAPAGEATPPAKSGTAPAAEPKETEKKESHGLVYAILMYIPNRVIDVFDVARVGVNVGPGIGVQVKATAPLQVTAMTRASLGVGLQSLRHSPAYAGSEAAANVSVVGADADAGLTWFQSPSDFRVELHPLIVGAHAAVDPVEILDFALGFVFIDIRNDDF